MFLDLNNMSSSQVGIHEIPIYQTSKHHHPEQIGGYILKGSFHLMLDKSQTPERLDDKSYPNHLGILA